MSQRRLVWRWHEGESTQPADFGNPLSTTSYDLCIYGGPAHSLLFGTTAHPGVPAWRPTPRGYRYRESAVISGLTKIGLSSGKQGESRILAIGRHLPFPGGTVTIPLPLTLQLANDSTGVCWESIYSADNWVVNATGTFRARHRGIPKPNVIVINTDDQRGDSIADMPTVVEQIAAKGVTFANTFAPNPVCTPSRASFLTGNHAHTHGLLGVGTPPNTPLHFIGPDRDTIAVWLQAAGYRTGLFGKYLGGYYLYCNDLSCQVPPGWDEWHPFIFEDYYDYELADNDRIVGYGNTALDYSTDVLRDEALAFLDEHPDEPLFVYFAPFAPHGTAANGFFPVPAPRHFDSLLGFPLWRPISYMEADVTDKPAWIQEKPATLTPIQTAYYDTQRRKSAESLLAVDEAVHALLAKLEEQGRLTDTIVIFSSDNGRSDHEHRHFGKLCPYEECIRVPLLIRYPRVLRDQPATQQGLATVPDLAPTIAEWARVPAGVVPAIDGGSLVPLALGEIGGGRDAILLEQWEGRRYAGVRTAEWKYVVYDTGERELYDLVNDPFELVSVADVLPAVADELESRILDLGGTIP